MLGVKNHNVVNYSKDIQPFNYNEVELSVANFLQGQADRLRRYIGKSFIQIGRDLIGAKRYLSHGAFIHWVESEVGIPARTAQGYMKIALWAEGKSANVALLPPSLLYILSAQTTPQEIVNNVLAIVESGKTVSVSAVRQQLRALRTSPEKQEDGSLLLSPAASSAYVDYSEQNIPTNSVSAASHDDDLVEVIEILSRCLSLHEYERVRTIMTSQHLLRDTNLAERILKAFERLACAELTHRNQFHNVIHHDSQHSLECDLMLLNHTTSSPHV